MYEFAKRGSRFPAYTPIVAGGENACVLHYVENNQPLLDGELILVDAGGEYEMYASDITRTFPVNGKFLRSSVKSIMSFIRPIKKQSKQSVQAITLWNRR